jgi:hypothetical protein
VARLFISYARKDGRRLAERLDEDLRAHHHAPWMDRSEIQAGEPWSRAIEVAIDGCEALLAVLTLGAYESNICRGEQLRALRLRKRIIPLLAQPDAERPVYVEPAHYLDFTEPNTYGTAFAELLACIEGAKGVAWDHLSPRTRDRLATEVPLHSAAPSRSPDWTGLRSLADGQRARFFERLSPRRGTTGIFEPALYVPRVDEERELDRFLESGALALLLIGDSGTGKTNVLCHWAEGQARAGHAVLMYHGDQLVSAEVERELAKDLGLEDRATLPEALAAIETLAEGAGRRLIVVFDGINEFRGHGREGPRDLAGGIDAVVRRLRGRHVRVVLSCAAATWTRLDRLGALRLTWGRYHRSAAGQELLLLQGFDTEEASAAFERYREHFRLPFTLSDLPLALRLRLHEPLLLRLLAETHRPGPGPAAAPVLDTLVFRRYYEERVRRREDQLFIEDLVDEMLAQESAGLPIQGLARHPRLGPDVLSGEPDACFNCLLDAGVLIEVPGDLFHEDVVRFTYPLVGSYALARRLLPQARELGASVRALVAKAGKFPLAWEAAVIMLAVRGEPATYAELAGDSDPEWRTLATDALIRLHAADQVRARGILEALLDSGAPARQRTALRAAFSIGPATRDLLVRGALSDSEELRQAVRDTLYLIWSGAARALGEPRASSVYFIWRHAPDFTYGLMRELVDRVSWHNPVEAHRVLRFVLDLSITIYVNHCERAEVARQTDELFHELTVNRLHLDRLALPRPLERLVFRAVAGVFAGRVLNWMLLAELESPDRFFHLPAEERQRLARLTPLLDPRAELAAAEAQLLDMLRSDVHVFRGAATLVMAVHACADLPAVEGLCRRLFEALDARGRLWLLAGFTVLLPGTPSGWVPLLEELTGRVLDEEGELPSSRGGLLQVADILFAPLGLAYGKRGQGMPRLEAWLADGIARGQEARTARLVAGLGLVGFYQPGPVLAALQPHLPSLLAREPGRVALVRALATMRTLHFDLVDTFLVQAGVDEGVRRQMAVAADAELVNRFVSLLGYYNNVVHYCLSYPRMRRGLAVFALEYLAQARSANDFVVAYAEQTIRMAREAGFRLLEWTRPD